MGIASHSPQQQTWLVIPQNVNAPRQDAAGTDDVVPHGQYC